MKSPPRLNPTGSQKSWLDREQLARKAQKILPGRGYKVRATPDGTFLDIAPPPAPGGSGTYHDFKVCRNGQQITVSIDSEQDPATIPDL